jgi:hypothetical protein
VNFLSQLSFSVAGLCNETLCQECATLRFPKQVDAKQQPAPALSAFDTSPLDLERFIVLYVCCTESKG